MVTLADFREYVGAGSDISDASLEQSLSVAEGLLEAFASSTPLPVAVRDWAVQEVASNIFKRREDSNGIRGYNSDGTAVFVSRDPMQSVYPTLRRYVLPW